MNEIASPQSLTPQDLQKRLGQNQPLWVLDVRQPNEREYCAIKIPPPTIDSHIPMSDFRDRYHELPSPEQAPPIVVYCHHGSRSMAVARWLCQQGYQAVFNLAGGIDAWSLDIDPDLPRY